VEQVDFLSTARPAEPQEDVWRRRFAGWVPDTTAAATVVADRIVSAFTSAHVDRIDRETAAARVWLERTANELCGPVQFLSAGLFDTEPDEEGWRSCSIPEQRLARFAADISQTASQRREAVSLLRRFRDILPAPASLPTRSVRMLGMLMLVP
jgi:hypothetical protein